MSFVRRKIDVTLALGKGSFGDQGFNTVKVSGLRVKAKITKTGLPGMSTAEVSIYGLPLSLMNQFSTLGKPQDFQRDNRILVEAGDDQSGMATAFQGTIDQAWSDMAASPETLFIVQAYVGALDALKPIKPSSFKGSADAAVILSGLATQMNYKFENNGVSVILSNPYYDGTARSQVVACARDANIYAFIDDSTQTLAIWPKTGSRGGAIPLISATSGMVGYPRYTDHGIGFRSIYNPSIVFNGQVQVQSIMTPANGIWIVNKLGHDLESETINGAWFTDLEGYRLGNPVTIAQ